MVWQTAHCFLFLHFQLNENLLSFFFSLFDFVDTEAKADKTDIVALARGNVSV
jgi:hypothetical protein